MTTQKHAHMQSNDYFAYTYMPIYIHSKPHEGTQVYTQNTFTHIHTIKHVHSHAYTHQHICTCNHMYMHAHMHSLKTHLLTHPDRHLLSVNRIIKQIQILCM